MKKGLIGLVVAGVVLGFGYLLYCTLLSGSSAGEFAIFEQDVKSIGVGGFKATSTDNAKWETPITVQLSPDMNPVAFNIAAKTVKTTGIRKQARYTTQLKLGDKLIWEKELRLSRRGEKGKRKSTGIKIGGFSRSTSGLKTFSVSEAGDYQFDVKHESGDLVVAELGLKVRENVTVPKKVVFIPGFVMFGIGVIGLIIQSKKRAKAAGK